jgi:dipeptidase
MVSLGGDGVLFAKNSDRDPNEAQFLDWRPAMQHPGASSLRCTWIEIPQVEQTRAVLLSRPWWIWGAEMGANDAGVVIGNEAVFTDAHEDEPGLIGMDLLRLALERAASAEEAVQVIVALLEAHGQGGSCSFEHPSMTYDNSFLIADTDGAIVLETAGRSWATETVDGPARSISNGLTIPGFAEAHRDRLRGAVAACAARREVTTAGASGARSVSDLAAVLRSHGPTTVPRYSAINGAMAAPCMHAGGLLTSSQTTASWIADLGRGTHWVTGTAAPCTSLFKPVTVSDPLDLGPRPTNRVDDATVWWRHERLHRLVNRDPGALLPRFAPERDRVEAAWFAAPPTASEAFVRADELESAWLDDVRAARGTDVRPLPVRRLWRRWDATSGIDVEVGAA